MRLRGARCPADVSHVKDSDIRCRIPTRSNKFVRLRRYPASQYPASIRARCLDCGRVPIHHTTQDRRLQWPSSGYERSEMQKAPTGISGLDDITNGGLPQGRPTLVSGGPGSGKTLLGVSFLVNGAQQFDGTGRADDVRGKRAGAGAGRALAGLRPATRWWHRRNSSSTTFTSTAARSKRPVNTISKACS